MQGRGIRRSAELAERPLAAPRLLRHWRNWTVTVILVAGAFLMMLPFFWMFAASMRPAAEAYQLPPSFFPSRIDFTSYHDLLHSSVPILRMYGNSVFVASVTTVGVLATSSMAAFAFSRLRFRGRKPLFVLLLMGLMVPPALMVIPLFFGMAAVGLYDSIWSLILPALANPLAIFMMREFMKSQPREYEESAFVDGAGYWRIFRRISLPQMGPPIAALGVIVFTASWNNFLLPLIFVRSFETMTLPVGILSLSSTFGALSLSIIMSAVTISVLPFLVVFVVAQRFIIESIAMTGVKG